MTGDDWYDHAACRGATDIFYSSRGTSSAPALKICAGCPVRDECLSAGMHERHGVWGGTTPRHRVRLRRGLPATRGHDPKIRAWAERMIAKGYSDPEVSGATKVPARTVLDWRRKMGITRTAGGQAA